ncbi:MAG TPA: efflux RND transporter periplasmic adaptor subunit [Candidatus Binataceae bacterium]|nr:efflux RND transporter periplasmic adaptor subunit [Candidatus Binataceae bacterium]
MQSRLGTLCVFALAAALIPTGCAKRDDARMARMPAVAVLAAKATRRTVPNQLDEIGRVEAFAMIGVKSRVEGNLVAIHFKEGDLVAPGQLLFSLDPRPGRAALDQAAANLAKDEAQARLAVTDEQRYAYLLKEGVGSVEQYDQAHATAGEMNASIAADRAAIETAQLNLRYAEIRSPIDGYTGNLQSHIGDLIKPDTDNPLVTITKVQPIYVDFSIAEHELPAVRVAMAARQLEVDAALPNSAQATEHGVLSFVNNTVDTTTGTILLKGLFQNENRRLWPGTFVNVSLTLNQIPDAIVIPSTALQTSQQGTFVFVVGKDMKVQMRPVVTGAKIDDDTVIQRGLEAGETVVTDGQLSLVPGAAVTLKQAL